MSEEDRLVGTRVADRYRVERKLGEGGMGLVYLAVHEALHKTVALKVLVTSTRLQREAVVRFEREAIAAANLKHPNIAEATDFGQLPDGGLYLVMEYVEGTTLRQLLDAKGKLEPHRALSILHQVGAALAAAHARDVVHRDLKPANVIVSGTPEDPNVKVIDFGIAKLRSETFGGGGTGLTQTGTVFGTPEYMSPEQVMGQEVDARADQYALGVLAFELLTGKPPFAADDRGQLMMMHVGAPVPSTRERTPSLPAQIDAVIERMLGKLPDDRFASVSEAMHALAAALSHPSAPIEAAPPAPTPPLPPTLPLPPTPPLPLPPTQHPIDTTLVSPKRPSPPPSKPLVFIALGIAGVAILVLIVVLVVRSGKGTQSLPPELASALAEWNEGRYEPAGADIGKVMLASPELAENEDVARPLAAPVADEAARRALTKLLDATALGRSRAMAAALAENAVTDEAKRRDAALVLLRGRQELLSEEQLARTRLRDAETCEAFAAAKAVVDDVDTTAATRDLERLDLGECKSMLRVGRLCDSCGSGPARAPKAPPPERGKGKGKGKDKKK